jgi:hypothetical protein
MLPKNALKQIETVINFGKPILTYPVYYVPTFIGLSRAKKILIFFHARSFCFTVDNLTLYRLGLIS